MLFSSIHVLLIRHFNLLRKKPEFIEFKGRGGTIIDDIVKYINERSKTKYGACIVFTDGEFIFNNIYWKEK